jgi:putative NADH-flavin reductase
MNIAVIAANGRSGKAFIKYALEKGHTIRAGVHGSDLTLVHPSLTEQACDATNKEQVQELIKGQDAVVSFIGHVPHSPASVQTDAMRVLENAMQAEGIKRIVSLTGTGVRFPGDKITLIDRVLNLGIQIIDPKRIKDGKDHVVVLQESSLDWTVIRVLKLQNTQPRPFSLTLHGPAKIVVSRQEVAKAVEMVLTSSEYIKAAPIIAAVGK